MSGPLPTSPPLKSVVALPILSSLSVKPPELSERNNAALVGEVEGVSHPTTFGLPGIPNTSNMDVPEAVWSLAEATSCWRL